MFGIFGQIPKFLELLKEGKELENAQVWTNRTAAANAIVAFLTTGLGIAAALGYDLKLDQQTIAALAGGLVAVVTAVNAIMHLITDKRSGLSSNDKPNG